MCRRHNVAYGLTVRFSCQFEEKTMCKRYAFTITFATSLAALFALSGVSIAQQQTKQKKVSVERAWKLCKAEVDKSGIPTDWHSQRYTKGAECMARHGHRL
jgi:hypothetical protein